MYLRLILDAVGGKPQMARCVELGFAGAGQGSTRASRVSEQVKADLGFASGAVHDLAQR